MKQILLILLVLIVAAGCSYIPKLDDVLPDTRTEYKKSEALPDLEVPPDLTAASENQSMSIPGEGQATLSEYKKEKSHRREQTQNRGQVQVQAQAQPERTPQFRQNPMPAPAPEAATPAENQWVAVRGSTAEIWPELRQFLAGKGYTFDLDDTELGVLDTNWSGPVSSGGGVYRNRYKVFSEAGSDPGVTVLYVTCESQEQIGNGWQDRGEDVMAGKLMVGELNRHFNNSNMQITPVVAATGATPASSRGMARIEDSGDGRLILVIPDEFSYAWKQTGNALQRSGLFINKMDQDRGIFTVSYAGSTGKRKKGWLSKLAFWKSDDNSQGGMYQVSLTGMGKKTELIVLDDTGNWRNDQVANDLLRKIESGYNGL
jgi:outer membrane protein assembly factor BamC